MFALDAETSTVLSIPVQTCYVDPNNQVEYTLIGVIPVATGDPSGSATDDLPTPETVVIGQIPDTHAELYRIQPVYTKDGDQEMVGIIGVYLDTDVYLEDPARTFLQEWLRSQMNFFGKYCQKRITRLETDTDWDLVFDGMNEEQLIRVSMLAAFTHPTLGEQMHVCQLMGHDSERLFWFLTQPTAKVLTTNQQPVFATRIEDTKAWTQNYQGEDTTGPFLFYELPAAQYTDVEAERRESEEEYRHLMGHTPLPHTPQTE